MNEDKLTQIIKSIDEALDSGANPIAAFDADGTLWDTDVGENFFDYQIKHACVKLPDNPWDYYHSMKAKDPRAAYLWLAQINEGHSLKEVHTWAASALEEYGPTPVFEHQKAIISHLQNKGVKVFIVTASVKWAVDPAGKYFDIPEENVIGVTTKIQDGVVTTEQDGPITYQPGKVEALLLATNGAEPFFTSGNTTGDLHLLKAATHLRFVNSYAKPDDRIYPTEMEVLELAKKEGWFYHRSHDVI